MLNQKFMGPAIAKRGFASSQEVNWALKTVLHQKQSELSIFFIDVIPLATSQLFETSNLLANCYMCIVFSKKLLSSLFANHF